MELGGTWRGQLWYWGDNKCSIAGDNATGWSLVKNPCTHVSFRHLYWTVWARVPVMGNCCLATSPLIGWDLQAGVNPFGRWPRSRSCAASPTSPNLPFTSVPKRSSEHWLGSFPRAQRNTTERNTQNNNRNKSSPWERRESAPPWSTCVCCGLCRAYRGVSLTNQCLASVSVCEWVVVTTRAQVSNSSGVLSRGLSRIMYV